MLAPLQNRHREDRVRIFQIAGLKISRGWGTMCHRSGAEKKGLSKQIPQNDMEKENVI